MDHFAGLDVSVKDTSVCIVEGMSPFMVDKMYAHLDIAPQRKNFSGPSARAISSFRTIWRRAAVCRITLDADPRRAVHGDNRSLNEQLELN